MEESERGSDRGGAQVDIFITEVRLHRAVLSNDIHGHETLRVAQLRVMFVFLFDLAVIFARAPRAIFIGRGGP
jgi:hypothetical protein